MQHTVTQVLAASIKTFAEGPLETLVNGEIVPFIMDPPNSGGL
jgi:hypothetical protein